MNRDTAIFRVQEVFANACHLRIIGELALKLSEVRYFLAICQEGTFTSAATRCGVSQPSLSNAIKRLEQKLGGLLFYRGVKKVSLTPLGWALRPHFKKLDQCTKNVCQEAARLKKPHM
jgi:LysR family transcriptional regulator, hydrogen peroxide-inducible genes activator